MIKKILHLYIVLFSAFCFSQNIFLTEIKATNDNKDKFWYALQKQPDSTAQYLGKIEVSGYSTHDVEMFSEIYKKAKSIGSNTYILKSPENIDGISVFNPSHYEIFLYYTAAAKIPKQENYIYIINSDKEIQIRINDQYKKIEPRSYIRYNLIQKDITDISVGKFLGSRVKFQFKEGQADQYFQVSGKKITPNSPVNPGISFKTGDLIKLEKSFALFLINIYKEN